jgi:hypothetical protein
MASAVLAGSRAAPHEPLEPGVPEVFGGPSLWGDDADGSDAASGDSLDPTIVFHNGRVALEEGRTSAAATGFILAMRSTPGLAPAILDLLTGQTEPILVLVRGDAQRIVGREVEAMRDHASAADAIGDGAPDDGRGPADRDPELQPDVADPATTSPDAADTPVPTVTPTPDQETP